MKKPRFELPWRNSTFQTSVGAFDIILDKDAAILRWGHAAEDWAPWWDRDHDGNWKWHHDIKYAPSEKLEEAKAVAIALFKLNS